MSERNVDNIVKSMKKEEQMARNSKGKEETKLLLEETVCVCRWKNHVRKCIVSHPKEF